MNRIELTDNFVGTFAMQVCTSSDATDEEILVYCNAMNPAGTSLKWDRVIRPENQTDLEDGALPVKCDDHEGRLHVIATC